MSVVRNAVKKVLASSGWELRRLRPKCPAWERDLGRITPLAEFRTVFDVGANVGQTATQFLSAFRSARIHCFEPCRNAFEELKRKVGGNERVVCHQIGLGAQTGERTINLFPSGDQNSLLEAHACHQRYLSEVQLEKIGEERISVLRLDDFVRQQGVGRIDLLKIDTQGCDIAVLEGAGELLRPDRIRAVKAEAIFVPLYEGQGRFSEMLDLMTAKGYFLVGLFDAFRDAERRYLRWCDALFVGDS